MTKSTVMELKLGQMVLGMKESMRMGRKMDMESFNEQTGVGMTETFMKMIFTGRGFICEAMGGNTLDNTRTTRWMGRGASRGRTGESMKENMLKTRSKAMECLFGQMAGAMKACGSMGSNMGKDCTPPLKEKADKASGDRARGSYGTCNDS